MRFFAILALMILPNAAPQAGETADAIYVGGAVYTVDPSNPRAKAFAVKGGSFIAVGKSDDVLKAHCGPRTEVVDLKGRCVIPGLIDAHVHFASLGRLKRQLDARGAKSYEEMVSLAKARAAKAAPGEWILGGRWDHAAWGMKEFPTHHKLSDAIPDVPVLLSRVDGHAALANRKAMDLAGITRETPDPAGGDILRDASGEATGIF